MQDQHIQGMTDHEILPPERKKPEQKEQVADVHESLTWPSFFIHISQALRTEILL